MAKRTRKSRALTVVSNEGAVAELEPVTESKRQQFEDGLISEEEYREHTEHTEEPKAEPKAEEPKAEHVTVDTPDADLPVRIGLIYTSKATVKANTKALAKTYQELAVRVLSQTASTIFHAAKHGDAGLLNAFYNIVPASQQQSFREWIVNYMKVDYPEDTKVSNLWLGASKGKGFFVRQGCTEDRNRFLARCGDDAVNNIDAFNWTKEKAKTVADPFGDASVAEGLSRLLKRANGDKSAVSAAQVEALKAAIVAFNKSATVQAA